MESPTCIFVIIGYNNSLITENCLASFVQHVPSVPVWLYDNASTPNLEHVAQKFGVPYLFSPTNLGFAGGANRAIEWIMDEAAPSVVCIVNNDILISADFARSLPAELAAFVADNGLAAMTPLLFLDSHFQRPENFGIRYYQSGMAFQNRSGQIRDDVLLNGAFLFLKSAICTQLVRDDGFIFQPMYFFNAEDVELSLRLLSRGFRLLVSPKLAVQHLASQSAKTTSARSFLLAWRNLLWTVFITRSDAELRRDALFVLIGQLVQVSLSVMRGHPELVFRLCSDTVRHRTQLARARHHFLALKRREFRDFIRAGVF